MKKLFIAFLLVISVLVLAGCACEHVWVEANCTTPKTCSECGEIEGAPLGHSWLAATCAAPKTCENCGVTEGEALPHNYDDATCELPKTCPDCGATEGEALGHQWVEATYDLPKTCSVCAVTEGDRLYRTDLGMDNDTLALTLSMLTKALGYDLKYLGIDEDGWPVYDLINASSGNSTSVNVTFEPTADGSLVYAVAIYTSDVNHTEAAALVGVVATTTLLSLDENFDVDLLTQTLSGTPEIIDDILLYYMESCGYAAEMQASEDFAIFWIYPAE